MTTFGSFIVFLPAIAMAVAVCWGSIIAFRGRKWWATWCMLVASVVAVLGPLLAVVGQVVMYSSVWSSGSSASTMASRVNPLMLLSGIKMLATAASGLAFAVGFVAFCARSGATERRAMELESMMSHMQARLNENG